jgi:hypothetical protein
MESSQHPSLLSHQHDFSSLVLWPHHWQPESFEITKNHISTSNPFNNQMTQVVPEHVARAKIGSNGNGNGNTNNNVRKDNNNSYKNCIQRSNSATLSTISVTCDTDTSIRSRYHRHQPSSPKKALTSNALKNVSVNPPPTSFRNHHQYKSSGNSSSSMSTSLTTTSEMNIIHEKSTLNSSTSTISIPNKHSIRNPGGGGGVACAIDGSTISTKGLSNRHKATSFDERHHRTNQNRGLRKSVLEHLVFVFPENVRRMLAGPKK